MTEQLFAITLLSFVPTGPGVSHPLRRFDPTPPKATNARFSRAAHSRGKTMVERDKALDMALGQIEKQFGKGSVMKMGDKTTMAIE